MDNNYNAVKFDYIDEISEGDEKFKIELINIFLKQIPEFINNMNKYLEENNTEELAKEAHTAKSSAMIFMMEETGKTLKQIQLHATENDKSNLPSLIKKAAISLTTASEELAVYLKENKSEE